MSIYLVDPITDDRWNELVAQHPKASAFHERGWIKALQLTYGYQPFALTHAAPSEKMHDGLVMCQVSSYMTGTRAVSLPFADHCEPLVNTQDEFVEFSAWLRQERDRKQWKYVEFRPLRRPESTNAEVWPTHTYCFHELDLRPELEDIFSSTHRNSIQRKVQRAEREGLSFEVGRSPELLNDFYKLLLITRKRLRTLPQPRSWFHNLSQCMGEQLEIWVARKNHIPVAAILTLRHQQSVMYKYGCSNERSHNLGGMPFLFWKLIERSKTSGAEMIDFGRSDIENKGLITFKNRFGTRKRPLTYYRYSATNDVGSLQQNPLVRQIIPLLPNAVCGLASRVLYRHMG